jgi:membrane-associated phospholipid phosphatase
MGATATRSGSSFSNLFTSTLADFARIPTRQNLMIAAFGSLVAGASVPQDRALSQGFSSSRQASRMFAPGEMLGSAGVQFAGAVATQVLGRVAGKPRVAAIGADLVRAQIVTQTMTAGIKLSVQRTRPDGTQYSLPSGHASTTFATATVLQRHLGWKAGVPAYALASYVAASRVQVKRHYLSDVALGATLGIITGRAVTVGRGDTRFAVGPSVVPGGAGVNFTRVNRP